MAHVSPINLQKHLKGIHYPISKQDPLRYIEQGEADENIRSVLEQLPDREYKNPADLSKAVGSIE